MSIRMNMLITTFFLFLDNRYDCPRTPCTGICFSNMYFIECKKADEKKKMKMSTDRLFEVCSWSLIALRNSQVCFVSCMTIWRHEFVSTRNLYNIHFWEWNEAEWPHCFHAIILAILPMRLLKKNTGIYCWKKSVWFLSEFQWHYLDR